MPLHNFNPNTARGFGWVPPPSPSPHVLVLLLYLEATETWNYDALMSLFDDSLQHWTLPRSLNRPLLNKRQYGEYVKSVRPTFSTFKVPGISYYLTVYNSLTCALPIQFPSSRSCIWLLLIGRNITFPCHCVYSYPLHLAAR